MHVSSASASSVCTWMVNHVVYISYVLNHRVWCGISGQGRAGWLQRRGATLWIGSTKCHSSPLTRGFASKAVLLWNKFATGFAAWRQKVYLMYGPCTVFGSMCNTTIRREKSKKEGQKDNTINVTNLWKCYGWKDMTWIQVMMILLGASKVVPW